MNRILLLGILSFALWAWPRLPERIPVHFGIDGRPDAWDEPGLWSWFFLPALAAFLTLLMDWLPRFMARHPRWVNLPNGIRLEDLPSRARQPVLDLLGWFLALVQTEILVIFALIQLATYRTAFGEESQGIMILVLVLAVTASPLFLVVFFVKLQGVMKEVRRLRAQGSEPSPSR